MSNLKWSGINIRLWHQSHLNSAQGSVIISVVYLKVATLSPIGPRNVPSKIGPEQPMSRYINPALLHPTPTSCALITVGETLVSPDREWASVSEHGRSVTYVVTGVSAQIHVTYVRRTPTRGYRQYVHHLWLLGWRILQGNNEKMNTYLYLFWFSSLLTTFSCQIFTSVW